MKDMQELLKKLVFTTEEALEYFPNRNNAFYYLKKSVQDNKISKIKNGLYALINPATQTVYVDKYMIASKINKGSFIAYHSALEFYGKANQVFTTVYVGSTERFATFEYDGLQYKFVYYPVTADIENIQSSTDIVVTSYEQTLIDCVDKVDLAGGSEELIKAFMDCQEANVDKLLTIVKRYANKCLYQKVGFIFEKFNNLLNLPQSFFEECERNIGKSVIYFMQDLGYKGSVSYKWKIIAPDFPPELGYTKEIK
ncbi:MAG: hypothetical protein LBF68_07475 [Christensenellaceae bacterium]|jgi:predicted transcriptional regulator of viral defense system|nr:hypothetical protein [Christensenellaceae bacterium]